MTHVRWVMQPTISLVTALALAVVVASCSKTPEQITRLDFGVDRTAAHPGPARGPLRAAPRGKVILSDTDHLWGIGGDRSWAWKSFTRGLNVLYMDPWDGHVIPVAPNPDLRVNMGYILFYARRMNLAAAKPAPQSASTGFCLADPGSTYLVYVPGLGDGVRLRVVGRLLRMASPWFSRRLTVDLTAAERRLAIEWFNPRTGEIVRTGSVKGGGSRRFKAPFGGDAILYLSGGR
jgi:hypothetical protein